MINPLADPEQRAKARQVAVIALASVAIVFSLLQGALIGALAAAAVAAITTWEWRRRGSFSLTGGELDRLREAELALASATDTHQAARELAEHAIALLGARSAVVLIEGIGDTVRVAAGPTTTEDVYGSGSRMRLLADAGLPCGSIAVSARADSRPYTTRHERILDALAERVSSTLHQLSLLTDVREERRTLTDLIGASSDGIFSVGSDLRVRLWNPAMARITGVEAETAVGEHVTASFRPLDADGASATGSADPGRRGEVAEAVLLQIDVGDEHRWLTCSYAPMSDGGYVVIARDDTERKKIDDDKDGWIAEVSHELRTPLTPIKGFLHTLNRRDADMSTEERVKIYEVMLREERRLEDLVDALLRTTQLDQGGVSLHHESVDWARTVAEQVDELRRQQPDRAITFEDRGAPEVWVDQSLAVSVLTNLLTNARKYGEEEAIEVVIERTGREVVTSVVDHGPGVPRSDRVRIFDKFTRLGDHLTRRHQGVGLGLHIARHSVEHLGGRVWVDETPGGGATFRFTLPTEPAETSGPLDLRDRLHDLDDDEGDEGDEELAEDPILRVNRSTRRGRAPLRAPGSRPARS